MLDRYPQLYRLGQQNYFFSPKAFWLWVINAIYHSLVRPLPRARFASCGVRPTRSPSPQALFILSLCVFWGSLIATDGGEGGHWVWGTTLYLAVLLTVLGKAALVSE